MTDPINTKVRDLLGRAMSDAPEPHPWVEVEQRAVRHRPPTERRRTGPWLAAVACVVALVGGLAVVVSDGDSRVRTGDAPPTSAGPDTTHPLASAGGAGIPEPTPVPEEPGASVPAEWVPLGDIDPKGLRPLATLSPLDGDIVIPTAPTTWFLPPSMRIYTDDVRPGQWFNVVTTPSSEGQTMEMLQVGVWPICAGTETDCGANSVEFPIAPGSVGLIDIGGNAWGHGGPASRSVSAVFGDFFVQIEGWRYASDLPLLEDPVVLEFIEGLRVGSVADLPERVAVFDSRTNTQVEPTTSPTSPPSVGLVELTSDTPMLWLHGVLVAAWIDGRFVPAAQTTGLPPELLGRPIELVTPAGYTPSLTTETDECGTVRLRSLDDRPFFTKGVLWSPSYPMSEVVGMEDAPDDPELDAALNKLGLDPISLGQEITRGSASKFVPSEDLDGDPDVEVVIVRYDTTTLIDDPRGDVWLAVWDPAAGSIMTLAGDPETNDVHFELIEAFADMDANGLLDAAIDTGDAVTLFELSTGNTLSSVATPCTDPEG